MGFQSVPITSPAEKPVFSSIVTSAHASWFYHGARMACPVLGHCHPQQPVGRGVVLGQRFHDVLATDQGLGGRARPSAGGRARPQVLGLGGDRRGAASVPELRLPDPLRLLRWAPRARVVSVGNQGPHTSPLPELLLPPTLWDCEPPLWLVTTSLSPRPARPHCLPPPTPLPP